MPLMTELFFWILCLAAFVQDLKTRYFSSWWLLPCLLILLAAGLHPGPSLLFCALILILHLLRRDWIGLADVTAMAFLSLLTGSALYPLTVVACLLGFLWTALIPEQTVPFVSCLSAAAALLAAAR